MGESVRETGETVSFSFARNERVRVKEAPNVSGKVVGLHLTRSGVKQAALQRVDAAGDVSSVFWDEDELEAAPPASASAVKEPPVKDLKETFRELLVGEMPAIIQGVHAADKAVAEHPTTQAAVGKAVSAATGDGPAAANASTAVVAASAAVTKIATTEPSVQAAAGRAASTATAAAPPAKSSAGS